MKFNRIILGEARKALKEFPDETFHVCVTSPPYYGLRSYGGVPAAKWEDGWEGCLGLEPTPESYVKHIVAIFREVRRVLRRDATLWINLSETRTLREQEKSGTVRAAVLKENGGKEEGRRLHRTECRSRGSSRKT